MEDKVCSRCLFDTAVPGVVFGDDGTCSYCALHDQMDTQYPTGVDGETRFAQMVSEMRAAGRAGDFDCIVGVSGGCDSSFLIHEVVRRGLRPLAVHFDNTWNSPIATSNIYAMLEALDVPLETFVVDNKEYDDIYRSFIESGVRDIEAPTDIGFMGVLYRAAAKHKVPYIVEGHSFRTEGVSPLGWLYMGGRYVEDVHRRFGTVPMRTYPTMRFAQFVKWAAFSSIKRVRPLYWLHYHKESTKALLSAEYGWQWYGGHHLENRFTAFYHTYFLPQRFDIDMRIVELSARVRSSQLTGEEAAAEMAEGPAVDPELVALVQKRLGYDVQRWEEVMTAPRRHHSDYRTYKSTFEWLRPIFWLLYKLDRVPKSFYVKFCQRNPVVGRAD